MRSAGVIAIQRAGRLGLLPRNRPRSIGGSAPGLTQRKPKQAFSAFRTGAKLARRKPGIARNAWDLGERGWLLR